MPSKHQPPARPDPQTVSRDVAAALAEDVGSGDVTAGLIPAAARANAHVLCRDAAVLCGRHWFDEVFRQADSSCEVRWLAAEGDAIAPDTLLCTLSGNARAILSGERTALNFLQTLSGTATTTALYVRAVDGSDCRVLDTRKTLPGLRHAQKYAVRCGGGTNHRTGLFDGILIKENHLMAAGGIAAAVRAARDAGSDLPVEVEVENMSEVRQALAADADILLLDNFSLDELRAAVALSRNSSRPALLEASGNITLDTIGDVAKTGVDYISTGAITKNVTATDLSMRFALTT